MATIIIIGMLCLHLMCFCVMFLLINTRIQDKKMGLEIFALGNFLLSIAYILQLYDGAANDGVVSVINHTFTLCAPFAYLLGAMHFFGKPTRVVVPLLRFAFGYSLLQSLVFWWLGEGARHILLAGSCALLFLSMATAALILRRTLAKDLRIEMLVFAVLIAGIGVLNGIKFGLILRDGLAALTLSSVFQKVFYMYMSFLGTVLPPCLIWLVLRRLTDELQALAAHDPLTRLLNRRGLMDALEHCFRSPTEKAAYLLIVDIDHFKRINDTHGHKVGDRVLEHVANVLKSTVRQGDLVCRMGGEEFVVFTPNTDRTGVMQLAERARLAIEHSDALELDCGRVIRCTVTIGISNDFDNAQAFDESLHTADIALYRGKSAGRNRVEWDLREEISCT